MYFCFVEKSNISNYCPVNNFFIFFLHDLLKLDLTGFSMNAPTSTQSIELATTLESLPENRAAFISELCDLLLETARDQQKATSMTFAYPGAEESESDCCDLYAAEALPNGNYFWGILQDKRSEIHVFGLANEGYEYKKIVSENKDSSMIFDCLTKAQWLLRQGWN
jgi:hypothetical protein